MDTFDLREYLQNNPLLQEDLETKAQKELEKELEKQGINPESEDEEEINEVVITTALIITFIATILAIPSVLQLLSTITENVNRAFTRKYTDEEIAKIKSYNKENFGKEDEKGHSLEKHTSKIAKFLDNLAHKLHGWFVIPIRLILLGASKIPFLGRWSWLKDESKRKKLADYLYIIVALSLGGYGLATHAISVTGAVDAIKVVDTVGDSLIKLNKVQLLKKIPGIMKTLLT